MKVSVEYQCRFKRIIIIEDYNTQDYNEAAHMAFKKHNELKRKVIEIRELKPNEKKGAWM